MRHLSQGRDRTGEEHGFGNLIGIYAARITIDSTQAQESEIPVQSPRTAGSEGPGSSLQAFYFFYLTIPPDADWVKLELAGARDEDDTVAVLAGQED